MEDKISSTLCILQGDMLIYGWIRENKIGKWIEVKDELNEMTIEDFDYSTGVVGPITNKHCAKCVSVNKC